MCDDKSLKRQADKLIVQCKLLPPYWKIALKHSGTNDDRAFQEASAAYAKRYDKKYAHVDASVPFSYAFKHRPTIQLLLRNSKILFSNDTLKAARQRCDIVLEGAPMGRDKAKRLKRKEEERSGIE